MGIWRSVYIYGTHNVYVNVCIWESRYISMYMHTLVMHTCKSCDFAGARTEVDSYMCVYIYEFIDLYVDVCIWVYLYIYVYAYKRDAHLEIM